MLGIWMVSALINTIMQELLVRGYIYQLLKKEYSIMIATIVSTLLFTFMHGGAFEAGPIAVINVLTMSLLMTIILEYTNSLLIPIIMHFIWNVMGGIIFGTVSLAEDYPHLYNIEITGNTIISGGIFKMEGSIFVFIINIVMIIIFYNLYKKNK
ncbi:CPBP family intramembrane glutamic endopeptidase [Anaerococcus sp. ENR1011]|uniref:CPBP family intramembrane glutamic endopeptidase n=1 Tax=Anaerococcus groningensis TaxID=3115616 RepID=A0ABW9MZ56_9FIRM